MARGKDILLIDAGMHPMAVLATRLRRLGYRSVPVKTTDAAHEALVDPRYNVGIAVIPPDLPVAHLSGAIEALRALSEDGALPFLAAGPRPDAEDRRRLRDAGINEAVWEPVDQHTLRFQINKALADPEVIAQSRGTLRVPTDWPVRVRSGGREKEARVYSISSQGAYLATSRPSLPNTLVHVTLPLPSGPVQAAARVVMTNVPGNLMRRNLPVGMGVRFTATAVDTEAALQMYAEERSRSLEL